MVNVTLILKLGPRLVVVEGEILGTCDNLSLEIAEATPEEITRLTAADEIRLVKRGNRLLPEPVG